MESRAFVRIVLFGAVVAVLGLLPGITLPIAMGVPITAQTLGVMLAGIVLGPRHGALAILLFLFVVLLGAPLVSGGRGGLGVLFGPSAGFLLGFVPSAYVAGIVMSASRGLPLFVGALISAIIGGILVEYTCGIIGLMTIARLSLLQAMAASAAFIPGDLLKTIVSAFIADVAYRSYPAAIASRA